jgi:predicted RNA binding protein YcfA (HicA-like mRNA interferase family)
LSKLPRGLSGKEIIKRLEVAGFEPQRTEGSHVFLKHPDGRAVTVLLAPEIGPGLMSDIMNEISMGRDEFILLLQNPKEWRKKKEQKEP